MADYLGEFEQLILLALARLGEDAYGVSLDCRLFRTRDSFEIGDVVVETFDIPHDAQDEREAEAGTFAGAFGGEERFEDAFARRLIHTGARVAETEHDVLAVR